ncbi:MAG TPA: 30S ribosomal protein S16 [Syntrophorhabdaceae bacterium]|nr:30S ribosomal protein S16 [Syntrophorhabdaceae bacterium]MDI9561566.1 30S ribosomal protein S16 [Pseudomonadota bacterium]OQC49125.1 MAG: 30S ribosomal protein S16 [Deltaproteobacteria bacterium ADurb.Bin026]MBP8699426.1 30S ribosomal protein S16 [Syntrophorhabdaceae bacterium]MBV6506392.1 30S ribosomal protein S16 [Syntrophorhabdaceae bacterium]
MAVKFRLSRYGAKKRPFYRIVVSDSQYQRDGRFIEKVGTYNPITDPIEITLDKEKIKEWYGKGVRPTRTVENIFKKEGILKEITQ